MGLTTAASRYEHIDSILFAENTSQTLRTNGGVLPNDRFLHSLVLEFRGRLTMPALTGPTASQADSLAAIMERITVEGFHKGRGNQEKFYDVRGADAELSQRRMLPSYLMKSPTTLNVAANATNDIIVQVVVPFVPLRMPLSVQMGYFLDAPNYESLKLTIQWGDFKNLVVPGATAATWSAYGSAIGTPELNVAGNFAIDKTRFANFTPGRIWRYFQEITGSVPTTTAPGTRIYDIPRGYDIRSVHLKTGAKSTLTTAGNNAYATYADFLAELRVNLGLGKYIRRYKTMDQLFSDSATSYNYGHTTVGRIVGEGLIDFAQFGAPGENLSTRSLISGPTGNVDLYLQADVTGAANQAITALLEEWRYHPIRRV